MKSLYLTTILCAFALMNCNTPTKKNENADATAASVNSELLETRWKLIELNGQPVTNPAGDQKEAFIILSKEGNRVQGSGGCNSLMGSYELQKDNQIKFSGMAMTRMACPDMAMETQLGPIFDAVDNYAINGKFLMLHKAKMAPLAKFEAQ